jgi:ABC-type glycerol-3-phosphate transport system permease component
MKIRKKLKPLLCPKIVMTSVVTFRTHWNSFGWPFFMKSSAPIFQYKLVCALHSIMTEISKILYSAADVGFMRTLPL